MNGKLTLYATMALISASTLVGCGQKDKDENRTKTNKAAIEKEINSNVKKEEKKTFSPGKHVFFIRTVNAGTDNSIFSQKISGGSIEVPDGYEVFDVENFQEYSYKSSQTAGYDIWYINNKTVEVESVYNELVGKYDYSHFGKVVEDEKTNNGNKELGK